MAYSEYWNPKNETLERDQLRALQFVKLRRLCDWAWERSGFHRRLWEQGKFHPSQLKSLDDLRRIPFMTREDWMDAQMEKPAFGDLTTVDHDLAIRFHTTSGTSGRVPLRVLDGCKDWEWAAEMWAYGFWAFGVRPSDRVFFAFSYGTFIGFWGAHYGCEKLGALVLPSGGSSTEHRIKTIIDTSATVVCCTPTYALRLWQTACEMGVDLTKDSKVDKVMVSGEPAGSIPAVKRQLEEVWNAKVGDSAGMTEVGTIMMFECRHQPGGTHIIEDHFIEECLEHDSDTPVPYGEEAERAVTSFGRGFIPLIRYRTKDLVVKVPYRRCTCGRTGDIYDGGIRGRWDDMKLIRGANVYPRAVEAIVREFNTLEEFQIVIERVNLQDEITVHVELKLGCEAQWNEIQERLGVALREAHEGLRFNVERAASGSLPRFELKAKRLTDKRPKAEFTH